MASASEIRDLFNQSDIPRQISTGLLRPEYLRNKHLTPDRTEELGLPYCTHAQMIRYRDQEGRPVVEVFQYLRPDGSLGASGLPDPKRLWLGSAVYVVREKGPG